MTDSRFFVKPKEQSLVKAEIVSKYFDGWSTVLKGKCRRLAYVDLYSGPGYYQNGTPSTPVLVLRRVVDDPVLCQKVITVFNDNNPEHTRALAEAFNGIPGIKRLAHVPRVLSTDVSFSVFPTVRKVTGDTATLWFVDPCGYKGLSLELLRAATEPFGCDLVFFFNYVRVNAGLANPVPNIEQHMDDLFGGVRADGLRRELVGLDSRQREEAIISAITAALAADGTRRVVKFKFKKRASPRTSHYLVFVTKDPTGERIMKEIMAGESLEGSQGVPTFQFDPSGAYQASLFEAPLDELEEALLQAFAGRTCTVKEVYHTHRSERPYVLKNYRSALLHLEAMGRVTVDPPAGERPTRRGLVTLGEDVRIMFPKVGS